MVALRKPVPTRMTVAEFLAWNPGDPTGARWQLIDGEPVAMAPASRNHGGLMMEVGRLLSNHLADKRSVCQLIGQPGISPRVRAEWNFRIPNLGITCTPPSNDLMVPDPVLLIEILSPSNEAETRSNIWAYTTIPSVREILAIDSTKIEAELLVRGTDGNWPASPVILTAGDTLTLPGIGFSTRLEAFYRTTALGV